jgi:hypothetical protein
VTILNLPYKPVLSIIRTVTIFAIIYKMYHAKIVDLFIFYHGMDSSGTG